MSTSILFLIMSKTKKKISKLINLKPGFRAAQGLKRRKSSTHTRLKSWGTIMLARLLSSKNWRNSISSIKKVYKVSLRSGTRQWGYSTRTWRWITSKKTLICRSGTPPVRSDIILLWKVTTEKPIFFCLFMIFQIFFLYETLNFGSAE